MVGLLWPVVTAENMLVHGFGQFWASLVIDIKEVYENTVV